MPVATDAFQGNDKATGLQRGRGGFLRSGGPDGTPYVTDPSGATTKHTGLKADLLALCAERGIDWRSDLDIDPGKTPTVAQLHDLLGERPKRVPYGSPSGFGGLIEDPYSLAKYTERYIVEGIGMDDMLQAQCRLLAGMTREHPDFNKTADSIVATARATADHMLAADRGTHMHAVTDDVDLGRDWTWRIPDGEALGIPAAAQHALVDAWREMKATNGIEVLVVEGSCVDDTWRLAGTLDRIVRCTLDLRFVVSGGEIVTVPADTVTVLDTKTGEPRRRKHSIQIASYAQARPYDTEAETRGEWPWPIDQTHALIAHLDVAGAIEGNASCALVYVDLVAGREHGGRCVVEAKAWEARKDIFSVAQVRDETVVAGAPTREEAESPAERAFSTPATAPSAPSTSPGDVEQAVAAVVVPETTTAAASPLRQAQADRKRIDDEAEAKRRLRTIPEEGDMSTEHTFIVLGNAFRRLPKAAQQWITHLSEEADAAGVPFGSKVTKTARRYEILRALVHLAANEETDEHVREWLAIVDPRIAQLGSVPLGHILGSLSAAEAATFAGLATGTIPVAITDDGNPTPLTAA